MKTQVDKQIDDLRKKVAEGGGGMPPIGDGLQIVNGVLTLKLGQGLSFDANGNIVMAYNPVVNVEHAILVDRSGS